MLLKKYKVETYSFSDFRRELNREDCALVEKMLDHIKRNKIMYAKLVLITALMLHYNSFVFANQVASGLDSVGMKIMDMLLLFAKWGCITMGVKEMAVTMINGGNIKQTMTEGVQYFVGYLFIQFYPQLFDLFSGIKF